MNKEFVLATLWEIWVHIGASKTKTSGEPVDHDWVQRQLLEVKEEVEKA